MLPSNTRRQVIKSALGAAALAATRVATAQTDGFPNRGVKVVVPFTPGGSNDVVGRAVAQKLSEQWKQSVIVDNRPGSGGNLGAIYVARAPADGTTLLVVANNFVINPNLYEAGKAGYDPVKEFKPVSLLARVPILLLVNPGLPVNSVAELIALAKAKPGQLSYASAGIGTPHHLSAELFKNMAGIDMVHIPYKGAVPAATDLVGGQVQVMFGVVNSVMPFVTKGSLKALAVCGEARLPYLPNVPRVAETPGLQGFQSEVWIGLVAPAGTPAPILAKLNQDVVSALADPAVKEGLKLQGLEDASSTPQQFAQLMGSDMARWERVIKLTGARAE